MSGKKIAIVGVILAVAFCAATAEAAFRRHYYSTWRHYPQRSYYYSQYYYQPSYAPTTYRYHYCIHYPSQPRYVYYYNPYSRSYWGRYDLEAKGYSLLAEKDRKQNLKDIPESAFPEPGEMPGIPESEGNERMAPPPAPDLSAK